MSAGFCTANGVKGPYGSGGIRRIDHESLTIQQSSRETHMIRETTTRATHRGVSIVVLSNYDGHVTRYTCTNNSGGPNLMEKWFAAQGEAIANERHEINKVLR
jgi:hypothetical protein